MSATTNRYDIVVWGATGFAGQLVAEHLTGRYPAAELSVALGGRNESKLQRLRKELTNETDRAEIPIVVGDATAPASLREMAAQTAVGGTTVGP